jgi:pimeloyl-ACP methyl ester carboxylesterase
MVAAARLVPRLFRDRIVAGMLAGVPPGDRRERVRQALSESDPATVLQATRAVIRFASHDWVSRIDVPTAVLVMTRDRLVPTRRQYKLARSIPGARVFDVDGDHLACVRAPERFVPALRRACDWVVEASAQPRPATGPGPASVRATPTAGRS